jgi:hypothetical protein
LRLLVSRASAEEKIIDLLNEGYTLRQELWADYDERRSAGSFEPVSDNQRYHALADQWVNKVIQILGEIFPTPLELNYFCSRESYQKVTYSNIDQEFGELFYRTTPTFIERLKHVFETDLSRYTDLPIQDRLFVEDIDSFRRVRDVNPAMVAQYLNNGYLDWPEDRIQLALEQILDVAFHKKDWGGETNDLYTANVVVNGRRTPTAFLLKGNGLKRNDLRIRDCGANGDQLVRLFECPAELFVIQFVGLITEMVIADVQGKVAQRRASGQQAWFLIMDGQDSARVLHAYGKL